MPKITTIPKNTTLLEGRDENFVQESDPKDWTLTYPVGLKKVNELHFAVDHEGSFAKYGLFRSSKLLNEEFISGMEVSLLNGKEIGIDSVKEVPVVEMVATTKAERNKGYAKALYEAVISRHKVLISDKELFTDEGKTNRTLGVWVNHLPKLGKVFNINIKSKEITPFNMKESFEDVRFLFVKNIELFNEGMLDKVKNFGLAALAAGALHGSSIEQDKTPNNFKTVHGPELTKPFKQEPPKEITAPTDLANDDSLFKMIADHEGKSNKVYNDNKGIPTIGIGFNLNSSVAIKKLDPVYRKKLLSGVHLDDEGIKNLYKLSLEQAINDAKTLFPKFDSLPYNVKKVVIDLSFNMGITSLSKFKSMIHNINAGNYSAAADDLMYKNSNDKTVLSKWFHDVTNGAKSFDDIKAKNPLNRAVTDISLLKYAGK